jgi:hypothetical protein
VCLHRRDAPGGQLRGAGYGARRGGVRRRPGGPGGAQACPVRGGHAEPARCGAAELLRAGARHRACPQVPVRRHAVRHQGEERRRAVSAGQRRPSGQGAPTNQRWSTGPRTGERERSERGGAPRRAVGQDELKLERRSVPRNGTVRWTVVTATADRLNYTRISKF